jgi:hypothetical protein
MLVEEVLKSGREKQVEMLFDFMTRTHNVLGYERWVQLYLNALSQLAQHNTDKFGLFLINTLKPADDRVSVLT